MDKRQRVCVTIPVYQDKISAYEQIAMDQCFKVLGDYDIIFIVPVRLQFFIAQHPYCVSGKAKYITFDNDFFADIPGYNKLMKSAVFYKSLLSYEFFLIYQLDAFVFRDELMEWCDRGYDNIGAPLFDGHDHAKPSSAIVGQGNGGFCLRNVNACYTVVTSLRRLNYKKVYTDNNAPGLRKIYRYIKHNLVYNYSLYPFQPIINEDLFWTEVVPAAFPVFNVPEPLNSIPFSFEVNPDVLFELNGMMLPFGCHAWWRYNFDFWKPHIQAFGYEL